MSWNVRVTAPADEFSAASLEGEALEGAVAIVEEAGDLAAARVRQLLSGAGSGQEGSPPTKRTGAMAGSIVRTPVEQSRDRVGVQSVWCRVVATDPGAPRVEFGAVDKRGIRTLPHPFMRPAFEELEGEIRRLLHGWAEAR